MSEALTQARADLAAAFQLAAHFGLHEGICNHFSYAVPDAPGHFLLNPHGVHWSLLRASDLLVVDDEGRVLEGEGQVESTAFCIHSRIHARHPQAACVLHTHMPHATALTVLEGGRLEPVHQNSLRFYNDVAYDRDYNGLAETLEEGDRLAEALGDRRILFMANHGIIVVGPDIARAFDDLYYLERACEVQVLAMSTGRPLKRIGDNMAATAFGLWKGGDGSYARGHFEALKAVLADKGSRYAE